MNHRPYPDAARALRQLARHRHAPPAGVPDRLAVQFARSPVVQQMAALQRQFEAGSALALARLGRYLAAGRGPS